MTPLLLILAACMACSDGNTSNGDSADTDSGVTTEPIECPVPDCGVISVGEIVEECCARASEVAIGNGESCHDAFPTEGCVTMVHGPQGGWHIWISFETQTFRNVVAYEIDIVDVASGESLIKDDADSARVAILPSEDECVYSYPGIFGYLNQLSNLPGFEFDADDTPPELLCNSELDISITITDTDGREVTSTHRAIASGDPNLDADICAPLPGCEDLEPWDTATETETTGLSTGECD
jgi:hypothetical protein